MYSIGIDFGTTNSVVGTFIADSVKSLDFPDCGLEADWQQFPHFEKLFPSVFADNGKVWTFGWEAKLAGINPVLAIKRLLRDEFHVTVGGRRYSTEMIAVAQFKAIMGGAASAGVDISGAVVTIPSNSSGRARYLTRRCAALAGIEVQALMSEPSAAALRYGYTNPGDKRMLVFDFGGGTLDVTVVDQINGSFLERASKGAPKLGGIDFDDCILELLKTKVDGWNRWSVAEKRSFELEAEKAKIRLSWKPKIAARDPSGGIFEVTRDEVESAVELLIQQSLKPLRQCVEEVGGTSAIDELLLVGGTTQMPRVRELVQELIGIDAVSYSDLNPMTAVAEGAAIGSAILAEQLPDLGFTFVLEHALGLRAWQVEKDDFGFVPIIPRNSSLPITSTQYFRPKGDTAAGRESTIPLEVWEGDPRRPFEHPDNVRLDSIDYVVVGPKTQDEAGIDVTFRYDVDGLITIDGVERVSGRTVFDQSIDLTHAISQAEFQENQWEIEAHTSDFVLPDPLPEVIALVVDGSSLALRSGLQQPSAEHLAAGLVALRSRFGDVNTTVFLNRDFLELLTPSDRAMTERRVEDHLWILSKDGDEVSCLPTAVSFAERKGATLVTNSQSAVLERLREEHAWLTGDRILQVDFDSGNWAIRPSSE